MQISGICHINLRADHHLLDAMRTFYCNIVGLAQGHRPPFHSHGYWLYAGDKDVLHLTEARPGENRQAHLMTTFDHVAFTCTDRAAAEVRLRTNGVHFATDYVPSTTQVQLFFKDPAGNGVELNCIESDA